MSNFIPPRTSYFRGSIRLTYLGGWCWRLKDVLPINHNMKGMCPGGVRKIIWDNVYNVNMNPLLNSKSTISALNESISLEVTLMFITEAKDFEIFEEFKKENISRVLDMIDESLGVNGMDQYGQTALMIAVSNNMMHVTASLLNARRPRVNVNMRKAVRIHVGVHMIDFVV